MKTVADELLGKLKHRNEQLAALDGISPEELQSLRELQQRVERDQFLRLIKSGDIDQAFDQRIERLEQAHTKELSARDKRLAELDNGRVRWRDRQR